MRSCRKNQIKIYYSNLIRTEPAKDEHGRYIGGEDNIYSVPEPIKISVSANKGDISQQLFGTLADYDRTLTITGTNCPINEDSRLWISVPITEPHDYEVKKKAVSLNETVYAIRQVTVQ